METMMKDDMKKDWVQIELPENIDEMIEAWANFHGRKVGWCLLCNSPIRTESDFLPGTNTHNCEAGREFEARHNSSGSPPIEI